VFSKQFGLSLKEINEIRRNEAILTERDDHEIAIDNARNEFESLLFTVENGISRDFPECFDPDKIEEIKRFLGNLREWYSAHEFERLSFEEYSKRTAELKTRCGNVIELHRLYTKIADGEGAMKGKIGEIKERMARLGKLVHERMKELFEEFSVKINAEFERVRGVKHWIDPKFSIDEAEGFLRRVESDLAKLEEECKKKDGRKCLLT
jgi:hypothetical protein